MNTLPNKDREDLLARYPEDQSELQYLLYQIDVLVPKEDRQIVLSALDRYMQEAQNKSYTTEPDDLIQFIKEKQIFRDAEGIFDLGAGPGQLVTSLATEYSDKAVLGIDLSPGFARNFRQSNNLRKANMAVGLIDRDAKMFGAEVGGAISVLTLDRLTNPKGLIGNMSSCTRGMVLATLLPVNPVDDNPSRQNEAIVYTRDENRLSPGKTEDEDRAVIRRYLEQQWRKPIQFEKVPYVVTSSGDRQEYDLGVFYSY